MKGIRRTVAAASLILSAWSADALGFQGDPPREPGGPPPVQEARPMRDGARRRFREELQMLRDRADAALRRLDEGADPVLVRDEVERSGWWRPARGGRTGRTDGAGHDGPAGDDRAGPRAIPGDQRFELTPEERQRILAFLDANAPKAGARLRDLDRSNPELVTRLITRMRPRVNDVMETEKSDPGSTKLRVDEFRTSLELMWARHAFDEARSKGDETATEARKIELRAAIGAHFDAQVALQQHEADRLAQRVEKLRADIRERQDSKDRLVERELSSPIRKPDGRGPRPDRPDAGPPEPR